MKFREIRTSEKITDRIVEPKPVEEFKMIKPESDITVKEARSFIDGLFSMD